MPQTELKLEDMQALDRNRLAADRTLMDWVRTALSMIGFGFFIDKFFQIIQEQSTVPALSLHAPPNVGLVLTGLGTFVVVVAAIQHWTYVRSLRTDRPYKPWELSFIVACLTAIVGAMMFRSILLRAPVGQGADYQCLGHCQAAPDGRAAADGRRCGSSVATRTPSPRNCCPSQKRLRGFSGLALACRVSKRSY